MSTLLNRLPLPKDDTEETIPGDDAHQLAVMEAYAVLSAYATELGGAGPPAWYVSSQVTVTIAPPLLSFVWRHRPDLFVVPGISAESRSVYDTRLALPVPPFVLEITGESTRHNDVEVKPEWYALLGVQEYLVFDPTRKHLGMAVRAWRRMAHGWAEWPPQQGRDGSDIWPSSVLDLIIRPSDTLLRFDHPHRAVASASRSATQLARSANAARFWRMKYGAYGAVTVQLIVVVSVCMLCQRR